MTVEDLTPLEPRRSIGAIIADIRAVWLSARPSTDALAPLERELGYSFGGQIPMPLPSQFFEYPVIKVQLTPIAPIYPSQFRVGDIVQFTLNNGQVFSGCVRKINRKTVSVDPLGVKTQKYWRVEPHLLTLI